MATEHLVINSVDLLIEGAWRIKDHTPLKEPADQRGSDRPLPGEEGVLPQRRRRHVTVKRVDIWIFGEKNYGGSAYPDELDGLQQNIDYLIANVVDPPGTGDGTRAATWHLPSGATKTASVHVLGLTLERFAPNVALGTLTLSLPDGRFV